MSRAIMFVLKSVFMVVFWRWGHVLVPLLFVYVMWAILTIVKVILNLHDLWLS